jgi:hypothetical protein
MAGYIFTADLIDQLRREPMHEALRDLGKAGRDAHVLATPEFRKLLGYLTEVADGRDRREPQTAVAGTHRPQPRLRTLINEAFGQYGDLTWFRLNKIAASGRPPLKGVFPRMAAGVGRVDGADLEAIVTALVDEQPDKRLLTLLNERGGRIANCGLELFTRLAFLFRPDLYFLIPRKWGEESGCLSFIGDDLRKYGAVCRALRQICDEVNFPAEVRAALFDRAARMEPMHPTLLEAINRSIGGALAWSNVLNAGDAYVAGRKVHDDISMPLEVASAAIRVRRGESRLRQQLLRNFKGRCAISGECPKDLLEVAHIAPYPAGDVNSPRNAVLLRSDLHTLWDLQLIGVNPETLEVSLSDAIRGTYAEAIAGKSLAEPGGANALDRVALKERWANFQATERRRQAERPRGGSDGARKSIGPNREGEEAVVIETFEQLEPKKSSASGIWRSPVVAGTSGGGGGGGGSHGSPGNPGASGSYKAIPMEVVEDTDEVAAEP